MRNPALDGSPIRTLRPIGGFAFAAGARFGGGGRVRLRQAYARAR
jgi:hypothetical protein